MLKKNRTPLAIQTSSFQILLALGVSLSFFSIVILLADSLPG